MNPLPRTAINGLFDTIVELPSLIDEVPLGIVVLDTQRRIVLLNRSFEALSGFSMEEAKGIHCSHIMRSRLCIQKCPLENMDLNSESVSIESDMINKDRQLIPVLIGMLKITWPVFWKRLKTCVPLKK